MNSKCYAFDNELGVCLLYGIFCEQTQDYDCFHKTKKEYLEKLKEFKCKLKCK